MMKAPDFRGKNTIGIGSVSLVLIFAVLCLTVFALLSFASAKVEHNLASKTIGSVEAYYEADAHAEDIFAQIRLGVSSNIRPLDKVDEIDINHFVSIDQDKEYYNYSVPMDETHLIAVSITYQESSSSFDIIQWQIVPAKEWIPIDDFEVWDGKFNTED